MQLFNSALRQWRDWPLRLSSQPSIVTVFSMGLTNHSCLIDCDGQKYVLRLHNPHSHRFGIDRVRESLILRALSIKGIAPKLYYLNETRGYSILEYIDGKVWQTLDLQKNQQQLKNIIEKYQSVKLPLPAFSYSAHMNLYLRCLQVHGSRLSRVYIRKIAHIEKMLGDIPSKRCLCHHGLRAENIIETPFGIKIIDWEYAGVGYQNFDLTHVQRQIDQSAHTRNRADRALQGLIHIIDSLWVDVYKCLAQR